MDILILSYRAREDSSLSCGLGLGALQKVSNIDLRTPLSRFFQKKEIDAAKQVGLHQRQYREIERKIERVIGKLKMKIETRN